jgi:hypothetical protein
MVDYARSNNQWYNYHGADGMDAAVNPMNKNQYYGFIQYGGALYKTENGGLKVVSYVAEGPVIWKLGYPFGSQ